MLAYLALTWERPHRREKLQALFWPDKPPQSAANNLRQALFHLRRALPEATLHVPGDVVQWNPARPPWVDALIFEASLETGDLDAALDLYAGSLLPDAYDEWAQLQREQLHLRYLAALEARAHLHYEAHRWQAALADAESLLAADPLNEAATRLVMACHWALERREAARRSYDAYRQRARRELKTDPLPETTTLYQRILRGESHPDRSPPPVNAAIAARTAHLSLLETLGAFRQGLEQATAWANEAHGPLLAAARRWQGRFYLRLGQLAEARKALTASLSSAVTSDIKAAILADFVLFTMSCSFLERFTEQEIEVPSLPVEPGNAKPEPSKPETEPPEEDYVRPKDSMLMIYIPAGEFTMGAEKAPSLPNERPEHKITLDDYWIEVYAFVLRLWREPGDKEGDAGWRGLIRSLEAEVAPAKETPFHGLENLSKVLRPLLVAKGTPTIRKHSPTEPDVPA